MAVDPCGQIASQTADGSLCSDWRAPILCARHSCLLCKKCPPNKKTTRRQKNTVVGVSAGTWGGSSHPFPPQPKSVLFSIISSHNVNLSLCVAYVSLVLPLQCLFMWALEPQVMSFWGFPMHNRVQSSFLGFRGEVAPSPFRQRPRHLPSALAVPHRLPLTSASDKHVLSTKHSFGDFSHCHYSLNPRPGRFG